MPAMPTLYWICTDCYMSANGISEHDRGEKYPAKTLSQIPDGADVTPGMAYEHHDDGCLNGNADTFGTEDCECERISFTWASCDGCGSSLAGERHAVTVWTEA